MATVARPFTSHDQPPDRLSGTPRAHALDRWIFVITAGLFIVITLVGFIPDSAMKLTLIKAGQRPPFPLVAHAHAVLMGSFLLLLFAQTWMMASGRCAQHKKVGIAAFVLAPLLVIVGFILAPTNYHLMWHAAQVAPPEARAALAQRIPVLDDILLLQLRIGVLFPLFLALGLSVRNRDAGLHKRMMLIAPAMALPAAFDRITWIPSSMPASPLSTSLYPLLALAPMFLWDVIRSGRVHRAYWLMLAFYGPAALLVGLAWDTPWWHATARQIMGV